MKKIHQTNKDKYLYGKWIHLDHINPLLKKYKSIFNIREIGRSFLNKPINSITLGKGKIKILMWTQMHGNEATATKVVFDLLKLFNNPNCPQSYTDILNQCTLKIIPILNPDGAEAYTRVNAQNIDLNRDAVSLEALESQLLRKELEHFKPNFCFNLHDQRNIYSVGLTQETSTIAFLSPATEITRSLTPERIKAMGVIVKMYQALKADIPKNTAIYNDEFYPNATGDNFQKDGYCTILIEAGHFKDDYEREKVRYFYFKALLTGLLSISQNDLGTVNEYIKIPQNDTKYLDILYLNVYLKKEESYKRTAVGLVFEEFIEKGGLKRHLKYKEISEISHYGANTVKDVKGLKIEYLNELSLIV